MNTKKESGIQNPVQQILLRENILNLLIRKFKFNLGRTAESKIILLTRELLSELLYVISTSFSDGKYV